MLKREKSNISVMACYNIENLQYLFVFIFCWQYFPLNYRIMCELMLTAWVKPLQNCSFILIFFHCFLHGICEFCLSLMCEKYFWILMFVKFQLDCQLITGRAYADVMKIMKFMFAVLAPSLLLIIPNFNCLLFLIGFFSEKISTSGNENVFGISFHHWPRLNRKWCMWFIVT